MLDIKVLRDDYDHVMEVMKVRGENVGDIDKALALDEEKRKMQYEVQQLKAKKNEVSKQIPMMKKEGKDVEPIFAEMKEIGEKEKDLDTKIRDTEEELEKIMIIPMWKE